MKNVDHPNIVKLIEVFFGACTVYLVMELLSVSTYCICLYHSSYVYYYDNVKLIS